jgi:transcriptional regulator with AAA-type ATPase domain
MNSFAIAWWIIFDACLLALMLWAFRKIPRRPLRAAFLLLMGATGLYFNVLFTKWHSVLGEQYPLQLTRVIFFAGILIHSGFGFFVAAFSDQRELLRNIFFRISQVVLFAAATLAISTDLITVDVTIAAEYPRYRATRGILYLPLLAFLASFGAVMLFVFYRQWRTAQNPLQKFQIGVTLISSGIVFVCMTFTNAVVPAMTQQSQLSVWGGIFPMLFFLPVIYLIVHGEAISLQREFARLLKGGLALHEDNQVALREIIQGLRSLLHKGAEQISRLINFRVKPDTVIQVTLEHAASRSLTTSATDIAAKHLSSSVAHLYAENQRMLFSLIRAESLLQEKWIANDLQQSLASTTRHREGIAISEQELDANLREFKAFWGQEIVCASPETFTLLQKLEKRKSLTHPLVLTGEDATGKALFCHGLHHLRGGAPGAEFSARLTQPEEIFAAIVSLAENPKKRGSGFLLRHADALGPESLKTLWTLIDKYAENIYFYLTGAEDFVARIGEQSLLARLTTLELKSIPLRNRPEDIEYLSLYFARQLARKTGRALPAFSAAAVQKLKWHSWPGNVTELREAVQNCMASVPSALIGDIVLPAFLTKPAENLSPLEEGERLLISQYLAKNKFNKNRTRIELGITVNTLNAKIQKYGLLAPADIE